MAKRLAVLLFTSSLFLAQAGCVQAKDVRLLTPAQLEDPAQVSSWLKQHAGAADKARAAAAYADGVKEARRNSWGTALKAYGLSALLHPTPQALNAYADALLRLSGSLREQKNNRAQHQDRDLQSFEALLRSALASDAVLASLSKQERQQTLADAECVAAYRRDKSVQAPCTPLKTYGLTKH